MVVKWNRERVDFNELKHRLLFWDMRCSPGNSYMNDDRQPPPGAAITFRTLNNELANKRLVTNCTTIRHNDKSLHKYKQLFHLKTCKKFAGLSPGSFDRQTLLC